MTTTIDALTAQIRRNHLQTGRTDEINLLHANVTSNTTVWTLDYDVAGTPPGCVLSCMYEDVYVLSNDTAAKTVTVKRGWNATTQAAHTAGDVVYKNPRWSDNDILLAVNSAVDVLNADGLYQIVGETFTWASNLYGYQLADVGARRVYAIWGQRSNTSAKDWGRIDGCFRTTRDLGTGSDFVSENMVVQFLGDVLTPGWEFVVQTQSDLTAEIDGTVVDVENWTGVRSMELLRVAAAIQLTIGRETSRNLMETQGNQRRSADVPAGAAMGANRGLQAQYQRLLNAELAYLQRKYPPFIRRQ